MRVHVRQSEFMGERYDPILHRIWPQFPRNIVKEILLKLESPQLPKCNKEKERK